MDKGYVIRQSDNAVVGTFSNLFGHTALYSAKTFPDFHELIREFEKDGVPKYDDPTSLTPYRKAPFSDIVSALAVRGYGVSTDIKQLAEEPDERRVQPLVPADSAAQGKGFVVRASDDQIIGSYFVISDQYVFQSDDPDFGRIAKTITENLFEPDVVPLEGGQIDVAQGSKLDGEEEGLGTIFQALMAQGYYLVPMWVIEQDILPLKEEE